MVLFQNQIEAGRYETASEVVRAGLRMLEDETGYAHWATFEALALNQRSLVTRRRHRRQMHFSTSFSKIEDVLRLFMYDSQLLFLALSSRQLDLKDQYTRIDSYFENGGAELHNMPHTWANH